MNDEQKRDVNDRVQPLYVTLILDETGSMQSCKGAAISGFNQYVSSLRQEPAETRFTFTLFNSSKTEMRYQNVPVSAVSDLDVETYRPSHTTPLYDADRPDTGGCETGNPRGGKEDVRRPHRRGGNASQEYSCQQIFATIKAFQQEGWTFSTWAQITPCGRPANRSASQAITAFRSVSAKWIRRSKICLRRPSAIAGAMRANKADMNTARMGAQPLVIPVTALLILCGLTMATAETGFDPRYERDYNIFNPANLYAPENPLNPANASDPTSFSNLSNLYDPGNPANPANQYQPTNPFNPANRYHPDNPLSPANRYNPNTPFAPLDVPSGRRSR